MLNPASVQRYLERLDEYALHGRLSRPGAYEGRTDLLSALIPAAQASRDAGGGPGDGTWMSVVIDEGWPEWLCMLVLSLFHADVGAPEDTAEQLDPHRRAVFRGTAEEASAYVFARSLLEGLATRPDTNAVMRAYLRHRIEEGPFSALACLDAHAHANKADVAVPRALLRDVAAALVDTPNIAIEGWDAFNARFRALERGEAGAYAPVLRPLFDFGRSCTRPDPDTPLSSLEWVKRDDANPWAPTFPQLVASCRRALLDALMPVTG